MNWKRGLFRAWIVLTALWLTGWLAFAWLDPGIPSLMRDCEEVRGHTLKALGDAAVMQCNRTWEEKRTEFLRNALIPPIALLIIGVFVSWIIKGFSPHLESSIPEKFPASFKNYLMRHWRGEHSLACAFFINGLLFYFLMLLLLLGLDRFVFAERGFLVLPLLLLFSVSLVWSLVGIARTGIKILRSNSTNILQKIFAIIVLVVVLTCTFYLIGDVQNLL